MKVTAQWIAEQCGVSRGTVDRVVNGRPNVAPEVRERVKRLVSEYGYQTPAQRQAARADQSTLRIAVIAAGWDVFSIRRLRGGIASVRHYFDRCGIQVEVEELRENRPESYKYTLAKPELQHIDGLVIAAPGAAAISGELAVLEEAGVRIATCGYDILPELREFHIGPDLARCGRVAAGLLMPYAQGGEVMAVTAGEDAGLLAVRNFTSHICGLAEKPVNVQVVKSSVEYALTRGGVLGILRGNPALNAVYTESGALNGCVDAFEQEGRKAYIVCQGFTPRSRQYLAEGKVDFVIDGGSPARITRAIDMLAQLIRTGEVPPQVEEYLSVSVITREML